MHLAIDALPINNFSGRNVLRGHLANISRAGRGRHRITVLHHSGNRDLVSDYGPDVCFVEVPGIGSGWRGRLVWQYFGMQRLLRRLGAEVLLSTSGALVPGVRLPQWVLVQNPWCFFPQFHQGVSDRFKALLQRIGYARAQRRAEALLYLSDYMREIYESNANSAAAQNATVYVGVAQIFFDSASRDPCGDFASRDARILTVSVMTPHKAIEEVLAAFVDIVRKGVDARWSLVGPWADSDYRRHIECRVREEGVHDRVEIVGEVDEGELERHYRNSRVFCLLSRCESFGIPAVEAQVFGTPTLVADVCAPPEIAGPGGDVVQPGDLSAASKKLAVWLTDPRAWRAASERAKANAERFRWAGLSGPIVDLMDAR